MVEMPTYHPAEALGTLTMCKGHGKRHTPTLSNSLEQIQSQPLHGRHDFVGLAQAKRCGRGERGIGRAGLSERWRAPCARAYPKSTRRVMANPVRHSIIHVACDVSVAFRWGLAVMGVERLYTKLRHSHG